MYAGENTLEIAGTVGAGSIGITAPAVVFLSRSDSLRFYTFILRLHGVFMKFGVAEIATLDGHGDPHEEGKDEESESPYPQRNGYFGNVRQVVVNFAQRIGDEARND
jgi:hypothetical protein